MGWKKKLKRILFIFIFMTAVYQVGRAFVMEEELALRNYVYKQVKIVFSDAYENAAQKYGLSRWEAGQRIPVGPGVLSEDSSRPVVVLIHGLDEPGRVWMNLAPLLVDKGFPVLFMTYPNDQTIVDSARVFFDAIERVSMAANQKFVIVCHSMGGLVAREMLTSPEIGYDKAVALGRVPVVSELILVGTPNHGAQLARFRFFMEFREQCRNIFEPDIDWCQGLLDGTGAAGIELIPGSAFLTRLNSRSHPPGVNLHVIAGILFPWAGPDVRTISRKMEESLPGEPVSAASGIETVLVKMNNIIGDGLVSIDAAALENIPITRVRGSHLTMIRNLTAGSTRMPPAIPVIFEILDNPLK